MKKNLLTILSLNIYFIYSPGDLKLNEQNKKQIMKMVINEMKQRFESGSLFG